jgi:hypothetical protein
MKLSCDGRRAGGPHGHGISHRLDEGGGAETAREELPMMRNICLLALPLSITACLDMSDQDPMDGTSSQALGPAVTITTDRICETFGSFCVGAPTIAFEDPVVETPTGRIFQINSVTGGVHLAFNADPTRCAAGKNNSTLVEVRACTVPSATWIMQPGPNAGSCIFQNQLGGVLSGPNSAGQFEVRSRGASGWLQQFFIPSHACN